VPPHGPCGSEGLYSLSIMRCPFLDCYLSNVRRVIYVYRILLKIVVNTRQDSNKIGLRADDADCSVTWTAYTDTNKNGGRSTGSSTVGECLNDCYQNTNCTAIDWDPTESVGRRCWLHGHWSTGPRNERNDVHHFIITRPVCGTHIGVSFHRGRQARIS